MKQKGLLSVVVCIALMWASLSAESILLTDHVDGRDCDDMGKVSLHIGMVRKVLCLRDQEMAAIGCSPEQAKAIMETVIEWIMVNGPTLETATRAVSVAEDELARVQKAAHVGNLRSEGVVLSALQKLHASTRSLSAHVEECGKAVECHLSAQQVRLWKSARKNLGQGRYRWAETQVSAEQRIKLAKAYASYCRRSIAATSDDERVEIGRQLAAIESKILGAGSVAASEARQRQAASLPGVTEAVGEALDAAGLLREESKHDVPGENPLCDEVTGQ